MSPFKTSVLLYGNLLTVSEIEEDPYLTNMKFINLMCKYNQLEPLKHLWENSDPAANNNEAMTHACKIGNSKIVKFLLNDSRVDPSVNDNYAIIYATCYSFEKVVKLLLDDPRVDPSEAFKFAVICNRLRIVKIFLNDPRIKRSSNHEAIHPLPFSL